MSRCHSSLGWRNAPQRLLYLQQSWRSGCSEGQGPAGCGGDPLCPAWPKDDGVTREINSSCRQDPRPWAPPPMGFLGQVHTSDRRTDRQSWDLQNSWMWLLSDFTEQNEKLSF